jgi:DNA-directed RNA polymerase subunit M/transcription elongation factor TFIIS
MVSEYTVYNLQEELQKYANKELKDTSEIKSTVDNQNNKHSLRDEFKNLLISNICIPELEATDLEIGIFNATIDYASSSKIQLSWKSPLFMDTYINISRSIYSNLKKDTYIKNVNLLQRLINKEFLPHMLPYMLCEDIYPEKWKNIVEKNKLRLKAAYEIKQVAMTNLVQCSRCKGKKISYYELQTRSGDESMTIFMNCLICGKKWKQ